MLLCKMKRGHGLLLLANVRVHHKCHSRRILAFCRTRFLLFCLSGQLLRPTSCKEAACCNIWSSRSGATSCSKHKSNRYMIRLFLAPHASAIGCTNASNKQYQPPIISPQVAISLSLSLHSDHYSTFAITPSSISSHLSMGSIEPRSRLYFETSSAVKNKPRQLKTASLTTRHVSEQTTFLAIKLWYTRESSFRPQVVGDMVCFQACARSLHSGTACFIRAPRAGVIVRHKNYLDGEFLTTRKSIGASRPPRSRAGKYSTGTKA